jgi:NADPH:quinone reductase-like Zn-dependent oxidoreductase
MSDKNNLITATAVGFTELKGQLSRIEDMMMVIKEKNEEMAEDTSKIKEAIYNPDQGIYSRLKELENWKEGISKVLWIGATGIIGSMALHIWKILQG